MGELAECSNAAVKMRRDQFRGEWMEVLDENGGVSFEIYCPQDLQEYVNTLPSAGRYVLAKTYINHAVTMLLRKHFAPGGRGSAKGPRHSFCTDCGSLQSSGSAEAGCRDAEIQAVTGQSAEMVAYYRKSARWKSLSRAAQRR